MRHCINIDWGPIRRKVVQEDPKYPMKITSLDFLFLTTLTNPGVAAGGRLWLLDADPILGQAGVSR